MIDTVTREPSQGQRKRKLEDTIMTEATDAAEEDNQEYLCLIRAKYKNENISTRVSKLTWNGFIARMNDLRKCGHLLGEWGRVREIPTGIQ